MAREQAPRRGRTPSADLTAALMAAAGDLLEESGIEAVTVRSVAARAQVAPMGVYSRFGGKDGLLEALFLEGFTELHRAMAAASGPHALARLRAAGLAYRDFALAHPHRYELMFRQMMELELSAEALDQAAATFGQLVGRVEDAIAAGSVRAGDPVDIAQRLWNAVHGGVSLELAGVVFTPEPAATFTAMIDALLAGLGPGSTAGQARPRGARSAGRG